MTFSGNLPIIKLEVQHMKHEILIALNKYQLQIDEYIDKELERICSSEYLQHFIAATVEKCVEEGIREEIRNFFAYGKGRQAIADAVKERLERRIKEDKGLL